MLTENAQVILSAAEMKFILKADRFLFIKMNFLILKSLQKMTLALMLFLKLSAQKELTSARLQETLLIALELAPIYVL